MSTPAGGEPAAPVRAEERRAELGVALLRVALIPLVAIEAGAVDHPTADSDLFGPVLAAAGAWAAGLLAIHALGAAGRLAFPRRISRVEPIVDLAVIAALTYTSGGPYSEARLAFFALPLIAAFRLRPALTAAWSATAAATYVLLSLPHPATRTGADVDVIFVNALFLLWVGAGAVALAALLGSRDRRIREHAAERGRLVAQALSAEDRERRRLAEVLHDDAIQNLLLARQELRDLDRHHDADAHHRADEALAATVDVLRGQVSELHPYVLEHAGLRAALTTLAESAARRAGARAVMEVDDGIALAAPQEALVMALARELIGNAERHAHAETIRVRLAAEPGAVVLVVADDGRGFPPERRAAALAEGHIGIATSAERARAAGGTLDIASAPGGGTTVTVRLPRAS